jgi:hypothetical protein
MSLHLNNQSDKKLEKFEPIKIPIVRVFQTDSSMNSPIGSPVNKKALSQ